MINTAFFVCRSPHMILETWSERRDCNIHTIWHRWSVSHMLCTLICGQDKQEVSQFSRNILCPSNLIFLSVQICMNVSFSAALFLSHLNFLTVICLSLHLCYRDQSLGDERHGAELKDREETGKRLHHTPVSLQESTLKLCESWSLCFWLRDVTQLCLWRMQPHSWSTRPLHVAFVSDPALSILHFRC